MLVKFHFGKGDSITLAARDKKGRETDNVGDAINAFHKLFGDIPFMLDDVKRAIYKRELEAAVRVAEEAEFAKWSSEAGQRSLVGLEAAA